ncbi:MAG: polymer-forming cytoskeletal protein [Deltaproteobacteria bacterium]|nr:polymer-forming cytoskeletal protein [Deltaproteobacteria bacterium]
MFLRNKPQMEVIIGPETTIKGNLITKGAARIDGQIEGNVDADWIIIGETGVVKGDISSRGVIIDGKVQGNITTTEIVEIKSKGEVQGNLNTPKLAISEGAFFEGHSHMTKREQDSKTTVLPLSPA